MRKIGKTKKKRGRPATGRDPMVTIRLPAELLRWIDSEARDEGMTRSATIRRLIEASIPEELRKTQIAYHEAGHAVIARALGIPLVEVSIGRKEDCRGAGRVVLENKRYSFPIGQVYFTQEAWKTLGIVRPIDTAGHAHIMMTLAGAIAASECSGSPFWGNGSDNYRVKKMMGLMPGNKIALRERLRKMTEMLVRRHKETIKRVAARLISVKTLDMAQLDRVIASGVNQLRAAA